MVRRTPGSTNVTVRKGLIDIIEEELVKPGYLGYTSDAEAIHDAGRLLVFLILLTKLLTNEAIKSEHLAAIIADLRRHARELTDR